MGRRMADLLALAGIAAGTAVGVGVTMAVVGAAEEEATAEFRVVTSVETKCEAAPARLRVEGKGGVVIVRSGDLTIRSGELAVRDCKAAPRVEVVSVRGVEAKYRADVERLEREMRARAEAIEQGRRVIEERTMVIEARAEELEQALQAKVRRDLERRKRDGGR